MDRVRALAELAARERSRSPWRADARLIQIAVLSGLLLFGVLRLDLGASLPQATLTIGAALAMQLAVCRLLGQPFDVRSPLITGLSLTLLLRSNDPAIWAAAGFIGVGSKFLFRWRGKHIFNPACFAIVTLLLGTNEAWITPGQWGGLVWAAAAVACAGALVLSRVARGDVAVAFLAGYAGLLIYRCLSLSDPLTIPLHQLQSGALLIFTFFMITDPRSTPDSRAGRIIFALAVALVAYRLQFVWQVREGFFYALALVSLTTPIIDVMLPSGRFRWAQKEDACVSFP